MGLFDRLLWPRGYASITRSQQLGYIVIGAIFVLLLGTAIATSWAAIALVNDTRAYATGEGRYSKAEKMAVLDLYRYAYSANPRYYQTFLADIAVPRGDHDGRVALQEDPPDYAAARQAFLRGQNHPDDVPGLISLFHWFAWWQPFVAALDDWRVADGQIANLIAEGQNLDVLVKSGELNAAARAQTLERITELDQVITGHENTFSTHMGEAARAATRLVIIALCACTILLWAIGTFFATRLFRSQIQLDNRLAASERRFRDFADVASDWYWEMDRDSRITYASERLYSLVEASPVEIIGQSGTDFMRGTAVDPQAAEAALKDVAEQRPFRNLILQTLPAGPASQYFSISGKPFLNRDGEFKGYRGVGADVTAQVRDAQALRDAKERAEGANRAKSTFLANMSHELRTPLNAIIGFSDIIRGRMLGEDLNRYADYANDINRSGAHLLTVINDILDLSRVEAGESKLADTECPLDTIVEETRLLLGNAPLNAGVSFVVSLPKPMPVLRVDRHKFVQILVNLLSNAFKFTPRGGYVTLSAQRLEDGALQIDVRDTGIGIAQEDIETVMAPFGQVATAYAREHQGTGLGVPLAKSLAELHGGTLALQSTVGEGTTVSVTLPASRVSAPSTRLSAAG